jgi:hypothetical protein
MAPKDLAYVFVPLGILAAWGFIRALRRGVATSDGMWTFTAADNPIGYTAAMAGKLFVAGFGLAELLFAADLIGDPFAALSGFMRSLGIG